MIRTAATDPGLARRMQRSFGHRVVLLVVLVAAIGGACVARAAENGANPFDPVIPADAGTHVDLQRQDGSPRSRG